MSEHPLNKPETEVKVACLWCNNEMYFYYEGSHDWVFGCQKCCFEKGFYVPHLGDEKQEAVNKWFDWVRKVQSCSPVNPLEHALTKSEERVKELEEALEKVASVRLDLKEGYTDLMLVTLAAIAREALSGTKEAK